MTSAPQDPSLPSKDHEWERGIDCALEPLAETGELHEQPQHCLGLPNNSRVSKLGEERRTREKSMHRSIGTPGPTYEHHGDTRVPFPSDPPLTCPMHHPKPRCPKTNIPRIFFVVLPPPYAYLPYREHSRTVCAKQRLQSPQFAAGRLGVGLSLRFPQLAPFLACWLAPCNRFGAKELCWAG